MQYQTSTSRPQLSLFDGVIAQSLAPFGSVAPRSKPEQEKKDHLSELSLSGSSQHCHLLLTPILRELGDQKARAFQGQFIGKRLHVLFENRRESSTTFLQGVSDNYIRCYAPGPDSAFDQIHQVRLNQEKDGRMVGEIVD